MSKVNKNRLVTAVVAITASAIVAALFIFNRSTLSYDRYIVGNMVGLDRKSVV